MRFKPRLSAILQPQRTTGSHKYTAAKTANEPYWSQSKLKPSARQPQPSADKNICKTAQNRGLNHISAKLV